jgi:hypothetical protein
MTAKLRRRGTPYTDVNWTAQQGVSVKGATWHRPGDTYGLCGNIDGASTQQIAFSMADTFIGTSPTFFPVASYIVVGKVTTSPVPALSDAYVALATTFERRADSFTDRGSSTE